MTFKDFLFGTLPDYFKLQDSYKDANGRGLLERYLENFGLELDEELYNYLQDFMNIIDPEITQDKFLPLIAYTLGDPLNVNGDKNLYRKILRYAVSIYKIKGTIPSYKLFFNLLGVDVDIIEYDNPPVIRFDQGYKMDIGLKFDQKCNSCGEYTIGYHSRNDDCTTFTVNPVNSAISILIPSIAQFLEYINAKLRNIVRLIKFCENYTFTATEDFDMTVINPPMCTAPFNLTVSDPD